MILDFFGKAKGPAKAPFKVDLHSHLIPGIDDGVKSLDESMELIRRFSNLGIRKIITTPHIMGDFYKNTPDTIREGMFRVQDRISEEGIEMEFEAAAEYYLDEFFVKDLRNDSELLTIGKNTLLFELPFINPPIQLDEAIFLIQSRGLKPLLAHPERYPYYHNDLDRLKEMVNKGVQLQININSLAGYYSKPVESMAKKLIKEGMVDYVGSDVHNQRHMLVLEKLLKGKWQKKLADLELFNDSLL